MSSWWARMRVVLTMVATMPLVTGCWDRLEIDQRATVLGLAIDLPDADGSSDDVSKRRGNTLDTGDATGAGLVQMAPPGMVELAAQIAVPGRIPLGPGEGGGGAGTSSKETVWVVRTEGRTLNDAIAQLQQQVADRLFFGHLRVIVISKKFAEERGLRDVTDSLRRNSEVRRTAWLVISNKDADNMMEAAPPLERVPTLYLMSTLDKANQMGKVPNNFLGIFESHMMMNGREATLPYLEVLGHENINVTGLAFFKNDKMVGTTQRTINVSSYMQLIGVKPGGYSSLVDVPGESGTVMWQAYRRRRKITVDIRNGRPHFSIDLHIDGNITEKSNPNIDLDNPMTMHKIDEAVAKVGLTDLKQFLRNSMEEDSDVVGFGEYLRAKEPAYWARNVQTKSKWEQIYPTISLDVHLVTKTHRVGMQAK